MIFDEMMEVCRMCERKNMLCAHVGCYDENDKGCKVVISKESNYKSNNLSNEVYERRMKALHDGASIS